MGICVSICFVYHDHLPAILYNRFCVAICAEQCEHTITTSKLFYKHILLVFVLGSVYIPF